MMDRTRGSPAPDETAKDTGIERLRGIWQRRKWLAIVAFALPCVAAISLVAALPRVYKSTVVVLIERQQVPEDVVRPPVTSEIETRLQTMTQEILSRPRLEELITRFNLYPDLRRQVSGEEVVERMRKDIRLELKSNDRSRSPATVAFALSYQGSDPRSAASVTNALASHYIEENLKSRERQATGTAEFLGTEVEKAKRRLDEQEKLVGAFQNRHMGELPQQLQSNLAALESLTGDLRRNRESELGAIQRRDSAAAQLATADGYAQMPAAPGATPVVAESPAMRVERLNRELSVALGRYTELHPTVERLRAQLADAEREVRQPRADGSSSRRDTAALAEIPYVRSLREQQRAAEAELRVLKEREQRMRADIAVYRARIDNTPRREQEFLDLSRDYDATKTHYQSLLKKQKEAQVAESMEQRQKGEQFRLVDPAIASTIAAAPNRLRLLALGVALSAGLAAALVMLAEFLNTSFHTADELRALGGGVPVLARIPWIVTEADAKRQRQRFNMGVAAVAVALIVVAGVSFAVGHGNERLVHLIAGGS
jgi:polysaccharide chain length determinant protein (PEP-CTERM system associated)